MFIAGFFLAASALVFVGGSAPARASCGNPGQVLDLTNWKETLPTGSKEKPKEIASSALKTFSLSPYFRSSSDCKGVVFRAPVNGVTTSGSGYPRSELREMTDGGKNLASWSTTSGTHGLFIDEAITAVPKSKKHVVAGQIHDADDDVIVIRLEYPKLFVDINGATGPTLDAHYTLGKRFQVKFIASDGAINVFYNGSKNPAYTLKKKGSGYYFKVGAYTQSNCSKEDKKGCDDDNYGEVTIYKLAAQHASGSNATLALAGSTSGSGDVILAENFKNEILGVVDDYQAHHDGFREELLQKLVSESKSGSAETIDKIAWGVYTLLPDIKG